jgi:glycine/D-amino acid oxidase-like deaminating enzyme
MNDKSIIIIGAGIAGVASAYYLSEKFPTHQITVIDKLIPLSFTTSCSGENFREYWPQPSMNAFVSHSIDLMKKLSKSNPDLFHLKYSGYDFVSHQQDHSIFPTDSVQTEIDVLTDTQAIHDKKPYLDAGIKRVEHVRNAGYFDVYALGSLLIKLAKANGVKFVKQEVVDIAYDEVFTVNFESGGHLKAQKLVLASGPFINHQAKILGYDLPIYNVKQRKFVFTDEKNIIPRDMPFTIYADNQYLDWSTEEKEMMQEDSEYRWLLDKFPAGLHVKPEGRNQIKMGWAYNQKAQEPLWQEFEDDAFVNIVMKGVVRFIPALSAYEDIPVPISHFTGNYTRTKDNLPVIGKLDKELYLVGALAGYGTMSACAAGELIANYVSGDDKPDYSEYFSPQRFENPELMEEILRYSSGQL